jgi:hypothetical protein
VPEEMTRAAWRRERGEEAGGGRGGRGGGGHRAAVACARGGRGVERAQPPAAGGVGWPMMSGCAALLLPGAACLAVSYWLVSLLVSSCVSFRAASRRGGAGRSGTRTLFPQCSMMHD